MRQLLAHSAPPAIRAIHFLHTLRDYHRRCIPQQRIGPRHVHGPTGHLHAWARNDAALDGALHVHVGVACAFRLDIADAGEAPRQGTARIHGGEDGPVLRRLLQQLRIVVIGRDVTLQQHVGVGIDKPRQAGEFGQIGHRRFGSRGRAPHGGDTVAPHLDIHRPGKTGLAVPQRSTVQPLGCSRRRGRRSR